MIHANTPYPHPGKYEGERMLLVAAHKMCSNGRAEDSFGDISQEGEYWSLVDMGRKYGRIALVENEQGFVSEQTEADFLRAAEARQDERDRENAIAETQGYLEEALADDTGSCEQCNVVMIQGVRCHETGCPIEAKIDCLKKNLETLENY